MKPNQVIDVSHWQGNIKWPEVDAECAIIKVTEAQSYVDPKFLANKSGARAHKILLGYYHFARGTDAVKEADFFVKKVGDIQAGEFLVLDWEIEHADPVGWCLAWLKRVEALVGFRPLLYINASTSKRFNWSPVSKDFGLWVAQYWLPNDGTLHGPASNPNKVSPVIGNSWPTFVLWQYTSRAKHPGIQGGVDANTINGDLSLLKKYGKPGQPVPVCNHQCPLHCTA